MTFENRVNNDYFEWLCDLVNSKRFSKQVSYRKLLMHLHNIQFTWFVLGDDNRANDGVKLRRRFALSRRDISLVDCIFGPCSVLEMMVALAIRCEENITLDDAFGNRSGQWFWGMINNLGLSPMTDSEFDSEFVDDVIARFLDREYEPDGKGGLFTVRNCEYDLRTVEIWHQLSWYLGSIT